MDSEVGELFESTGCHKNKLQFPIKKDKTIGWLLNLEFENIDKKIIKIWNIKQFLIVNYEI